MFKFLPGLFLIFFSIDADAQKIKVLNETTLQPVENVYVFNEDRSEVAVTNAGGEADLSTFGETDRLTFQHPSYKRLSVSYRKLEESDFVVKLAERFVLMDEVFVSATKREEDQSEIPQRITQIEGEKIQFSNVQTSADLLQATGEVFVQKSQLGGGSPMIRGFAANSVLIAVDGVRMNNAIFRGGNLQNVISIDPNALKTVEVMYGPGSIIYGSDALGGVMNFRTKNPELSFSEGKPFVRANSLARYSSADFERTVHADGNIGFEKWGSFTSLTYSKYGDLRSGSHFYDEYPDWGKRTQYVVRENGTDVVVNNDNVTLQKFSGYDQFNVMQKIRYKPSSTLDFNYGLHYATTTDIPRYDRLIQRKNGDTGPLKSAEWYYGPQIWMMNTLNVDLLSPAAIYNKVSGTFSYQWFQESRNDRKFQSSKLRNREENVDVLTANIDFDKYWDNGGELYYGFESIYNYVKSNAHITYMNTGADSAAATRYPDGGSRYTQLAAYAKYKYDLSDRATALGGIRYSHILLKSRFNSKKFYDFPFSTIRVNTGALSGSLGLTYRPIHDLQFNIHASTGFRAPNVDDVAKVFDSEPGSVVVPNANVKPEHSYNIEFGIIKKVNNIARLEVTTFYTWLKDAMVRRNFQFNGQDSIMYDGQLSNVEAIVNAGEAYIYGISASAGIEMGNHFALNTSLTYTKGKDTSNDEPLRHVAPLFGRTSLNYKGSNMHVELYSEYNAAKNISDFAPSERNKTHLYTEDGTPGWATLNLKASYQINKTLQLSAGVENILDKYYRPYSSGIGAPGRNVILALRASM